MLRELKQSEIEAISGGQMEYDSPEPQMSDDGSGGDYGLGDMGGWSLPPGDDQGGIGEPYDPSTDPNRTGYGDDPQNPYENPPSQSDSSGGMSNSQLGDYSPSSSPSSPPSISQDNPSLSGPYYNFGGGVSGGPGVYDYRDPSQGGGIRGKAQL